MRDPYATGRDEGAEIIDYVAVLRRQLPLIAISVTVGLVLALIYSMMKTPTYTATAEVLVRPPTATSSGLRPDQVISMDTEARLVTSAPIAQLAQKSLGTGQSVTQLLKHVSVETSADTFVLDVHFADQDAGEAAQGANAFAKAYLDYRSAGAQQDIAAQRQAIEDQLKDLRSKERDLRDIVENNDPASSAAVDAQDQLDDLQVQFAVLASQLANIPTFVDAGDVILPATAPTSASSPNVLLNVLAGMFLGLFVGVVIGFIRDRADDRIHGRGGIPSILQAPVLAYVPRMGRRRANERTNLLVVETDPRGAAAEAYRSMRTSVMSIGRRREAKVMAIVSPGEQEGKSTTAANLAASLGHADQQVAVVCADMRRPRLHTLFGVSNERGLSDVLLGTIELEDALIRTDVLNLSIIPGGQVPVRPAELLQSQAMISMMEELREKFDFVILDCPPILGLSDCLALVPLADATIMVVEAERTRAGAIADAVEQLDHVNVTVEGVVLNAVRVGRRGHHSYGYFLAAPKHLEADVVQANGDRQGVAALEDRRASGQKDKSKRTMPRAVGSSDPDS
jgi:capsular exopolysaccharide synthesis family protein